MAIQVSTLVGAYVCRETSRQFGLQVHFVDKEKRCTCGQPGCRHVKAVTEYLQGGGERASVAALASADTSPTSPVVPATCPICGCVVQHEARSPVWRCVADCAHYWQWRGERGGVAAFLTRRHPAKRGAFYEQSVEEREAFLAQAYRQLLLRHAAYV
jgi:hypothetical protein